jgi:ribonuclease R
MVLPSSKFFEVGSLTSLNRTAEMELNMIEKKEKIVLFMKEEAYKPLLLKELASILAVPASEIDLLKEILEQLEVEGKIYKTNKERYGIPERMNLISGKLQGNEKGFGFVLPDDNSIGDIFIPADSLNGSLHGDKVLAKITKKNAGNRRTEGEIVKVVSHVNKTIVGIFEKSNHFGFVIPDNKKISGDIFIPKGEFNKAKPGQKVVVELVKWPEKRRNAEGKIIEIIGHIDEAGTDIISIIKSYNLNEEFPDDVLEQADSIPEIVSSDMSKDRRDLRNLIMVTIDGEDAKDLDDAVSVEKLENSNFLLGVHIADVSHYVKENSPLDKEAQKRGTSVYLVDRVIPMLPKKLSNGICSLNPKVDRLSFTVMMEIDKTGKVVSHEIFESVININERMTYTNVYKILEKEDIELKGKYNDLLPLFYNMKELSIILRKKRMDRGAIDFDFDEAKIVIDSKGNPIEVKRYETTIANKIIEEFMLACNETVAEHYFWANCPYVYRVHEEPDIEKIDNLNEFLYNFGLSIKGVNKIHPKALQEVVSKVKGEKEEKIVSTVMLRSLKKARYSNLNAGHFGLAAKFYSHFTSPIRRYPDLLIHRIMKEAIKGKMIGSREEYYNNNLPELTRHCSERERMAEEAERDTEDLKKTEYMKRHEGDVFEGIISGVASFGFFVELENTIEGLVKVNTLFDDYYVFDEKHYCLIGERTKKVYKIGDSVKVLVAKADVSIRKIDFMLIDNESDLENIAAKKEKHIANSKKRDTKLPTGNDGQSNRGKKKSAKATENTISTSQNNNFYKKISKTKSVKPKNKKQKGIKKKK